MVIERVPRSGSRSKARLAAGPVLTLIVAIIIEVLPLGPVPALPLIFMLCIAYAVLAGGLLSGISSSVIAVAGATYHYAEMSAPFRISSVDVQRLAIFVLAVPIVVATLWNLRQRLDELLVRERGLRSDAEHERERVVAILESITDGFFALDHEWRYTYVNRQAEHLVGRTREELLGEVVWDAFPPLVGSTWDREYHRAVEQRVSVHFEEYYPPLHTWFETHAYPSDEGITIYIRSINERKRAEQALRERARQQEAVVHLGQQALVSTDIQSLMDAAVRTVGATLNVEFVELLELVPDGTELVMRAGIGWKDGGQRVAAGDGSQAGYTLMSREPVVVEDLAAETRFQQPALLREHNVRSGMTVGILGRERPFGVLGAHTRSARTFSRDDVHFFEAVAHVLAGVIERKRGVDALAESELRFRQIAENVREVFYVTAISPLKVLYANPAYEKVWGRSRAILYGRPRSWLEAIHPDDRRRVEQHLTDRDTHSFGGAYRIIRPDGTTRWIRDRASPVRDEQGRVYRLVGVAEDITELHEAAQVATRLAASEASVRARDEVLAIVAHDLRNPLNTISMAAHLIDQWGLSVDKKTEQIKLIQRAVESADTLIRDLLDAARMQAGQLALEPEPLDVNSLISEACDAFDGPASAKSIALTQDVARSLPPILGDRERILRVLANLLSNALEYTPHGGAVTVRARLDKDGVQFSVQDTGPGISPDALPHVFDRFWRARPADWRGLGLGLSIVKGIVSAHHGRVWVESEPGKGSTFYFTLPSVSGSS